MKLKIDELIKTRRLEGITICNICYELNSLEYTTEKGKYWSENRLRSYSEKVLKLDKLKNINNHAEQWFNETL